MDINDLRSGVTVLLFVLFCGIVWWAYSDRRKQDFAEAARLPLDDDLPYPSAEAHPTSQHGSRAPLASMQATTNQERKSS